ncbi:hypothetical protein A2V71_02235 [Candidatus Berkelbacteria bacterium RBG_13_40_8]|uniref:Uncharacterized protein n=1 Tax=Candidatus Berkelbacteria bacterium RBG_13_40_8 TaxID=1797467 RepID=A0A1F5DPW0_9BACT|nr:MAG: hypothetical protein A2V71_02235 [Candidatus Berkelbacteria bacterium RBG_13_40_8]
MKIAIDATRAVIEKAGIGRICFQLIKKMLEVDKQNEYLLLFTYFRSDLKKEKLIKEFEGPNVKTKILKIPGNLKEKVWGWRLSWFNKLVKGSDVFLAPSFLEVNQGLKIPQVLIIYDLTTFLFPEQRGKGVSERLSKKTVLACQKAAKIITISESTKKDLIRLLKISPSKVEVIYPGLTKFPKIAKKLPKGLKSKKYILSVGTLEPRKNIKNLLLAYNLLSGNLKKEYKLVICGARGWNIDDEVKEISENKSVSWLGHIEDDILAKLYKEAKVFVYPSLYEGFGLPVAEAMQFGTPVITSNISSMPEVAQKAGILIDPRDIKAISRALQGVLEGKFKVQPQDLETQAAKFSWEKNAKETLEVLEEVANG